MLFRVNLLIFIFTFCGCGSSSSPNSRAFDSSANEFSIGRSPSAINTAYLWGQEDDKNVINVDQSGRFLMHFQTEPFAHMKTLSLPFNNHNQKIVSGLQAQYHISISEDNYAIIKQDNTQHINPIELISRIESIAFDPNEQLVVLTDEFQSMALLSLSEEGEVINSWKAGSLFPDKQYATAGTMASDGRLVVALGEKTIAVVDLKETIINKQWIFDSFEIIEASGIRWLATASNIENTILVESGNVIYSVDISAQMVVDQFILDESIQIINKYYDYNPHYIMQGAISTPGYFISVLYIDDNGKFSLKNLKIGVTNSLLSEDLIFKKNIIQQSWLDDDRLTLVIDTSHYLNFYQSSLEVYRFRLSDNLALDKSLVNNQAALIVTPNYLISVYDSPLGKATRQSYGKIPNVETLEGYNLESLIQIESQ